MTGGNPDPFIGFSYSVIMQYYGCVSVKDIITKSLDVLTIVVPPALPVKVQKRQYRKLSNLATQNVKSCHHHFEPFQAALAVGITYAQTRLKKKNIFTVSPKRINLCGSGEFS